MDVQWTVQEMASPLTQEIVELVDREADLLNRYSTYSATDRPPNNYPPNNYPPTNYPPNNYPPNNLSTYSSDHRGRAVKSMESLRLRIHHLFLRFLENPEYNPRAVEFLVEK